MPARGAGFTAGGALAVGTLAVETLGASKEAPDDCASTVVAHDRLSTVPIMNSLDMKAVLAARAELHQPASRVSR